MAGSAEAQAHGRRAERNEPRLLTHDRFGHRIDQVELDPSWHWLLRGAVEREIHALPWRDPRPGAHVARAALELLWTQANAGVMCPVSMTYSAVPALRVDEGLAAEWEPRLTLPDYERGALCGMAMTEKQGGSDVRANTTRARVLGRRLVGAARPQVVLLLSALRRLPRARPGARAASRASCSSAGRGWSSSGSRTSSARARCRRREVEFRGAAARLLGEEGRGVATIIEMVTHTRLDCVIGSAAGMRRGVAEAVWHARHRSAFGARLYEQPLMRNVLADLALESEAATATALRLARAYDEGDTGLPPLRHRGAQVLDLQAGGPARRGGARVPGRQRLRRGVADAAAAARLAAERDLGGLGQRHEPRRAAGDGARAARACPPSWPSASWRAAPIRGSTPTSTGCP